MESNNHINFVIFAENKESVSSIANILVGSNESNGEWTGIQNGRTIKAYVRYPNSLAQASPKGSTDVLIVKVPADCEESYIETIKNYVNTRKGIPFKYITSSKDHSQLASFLKAEYINESQLASSTSQFITKVVELESSLKTTFEIFDLNLNGFITQDELVKASARLGYELNNEEANLIVKSLSHDGNIDFQMFKTWWVMGRGDLNIFRRIIDAQNEYLPILKQGSQAFNDYVKEILNKAPANDFYEGIIRIGPKEEFETGIGLSVDFSAGTQFEEVLKTYPDYIEASPISFSLEIKLRDASYGNLLIEALKGFKEQISQSPKISSVLMSGFEFNFRHVGLSVFIDLTFSGMMRQMGNMSLNAFNLEDLKFSGAGNVIFFAGYSLNDFFNDNLQTLISKLLKLRFTSHADLTGIKPLFYGIAKILSESSAVPKEIKKIASLVNILSASRNFKLEFSYDAEELKESIMDIYKDLLSLTGETINQKLEENEFILQKVREKVIRKTGRVKKALDELAPELKKSMEYIDFDKIGVSVVVPKFKVQCKGYFYLPGMTKFVQEQILN